jgi:hypothetical protein
VNTKNTAPHRDFDTGHVQLNKLLDDFVIIFNGQIANVSPSAFRIPRADKAGKLANEWLHHGAGNGLDADTVDGYHAIEFQPHDIGLDDISELVSGTGTIIVGDGTNWTAKERGAALTGTTSALSVSATQILPWGFSAEADWTTVQDTVNNHKTRLDELEARLKGYGLLPE